MATDGTSTDGAPQDSAPIDGVAAPFDPRTIAQAVAPTLGSADQFVEMNVPRPQNPSGLLQQQQPPSGGGAPSTEALLNDLFAPDESREQQDDGRPKSGVVSYDQYERVRRQRDELRERYGVDPETRRGSFDDAVEFLRGHGPNTEQALMALRQRQAYEAWARAQQSGQGDGSPPPPMPMDIGPMGPAPQQQPDPGVSQLAEQLARQNDLLMQMVQGQQQGTIKDTAVEALDRYGLTNNPAAIRYLNMAVRSNDSRPMHEIVGEFAESMGVPPAAPAPSGQYQQQQQQQPPVVPPHEARAMRERAAQLSPDIARGGGAPPEPAGHLDLASLSGEQRAQTAALLLQGPLGQDASQGFLGTG